MPQSPNINVLSQEEMEMYEVPSPVSGIHGAWLIPHTPEMTRLLRRIDASGLWAIPTVQHRSAAILKYYGGFEGAFEHGLVRASTDRAPNTTLYLEGTPEAVENLKFTALEWYEFRNYPWVKGARPSRVVLDLHTPSVIVSREMTLDEFINSSAVPEYPQADVREEMRERLLQGGYRRAQVRVHARRRRG